MDGPNASGLVACVLLGMLFLGIPVYATTIYAEDFSSPAKLSNDGATAELGNGGSYALGTWIYATANMGIDDPARGAGDGSSPANAISSVGQARPQNGRGTNARALSIILDRWLFTGGVEYTVSFDVIGRNKDYLKEDTLYDIVFYKGAPIEVIPPTFMEVKITETSPGARGDTASGRVLKPATVETGAQIQVPIFVDEGEKIKIDTRTGEYVSRV